MTNNFKTSNEKSPYKKDRTPKFENSYAVVNELELKSKTKISGNLRRVLEFIAHANLSRSYPTRRDIETELKTISFESLKKILSRAVDSELLVIHLEKRGHDYQYVLSNLQDYEENKTKLRKRDADHECNEIQIELFITALFRIISEFTGKNKMMFHHFLFSSELDDADDFTRLNWDMPSNKNKARKHEFKLSRHRSCIVTIYPTKSVTIAINCSKEPFDLFSIEGINELHAVCGIILKELIDSSKNPQPLKTEIPDWKIVQIDAAYDIPLNEMLPDAAKISHKGNGQNNIISIWPRCLRIKHLNRIYQIYLKNLPTRGPCLRIERRFAFRSLQPTVDMFKEHLYWGKDSENL